MSPQDYLFLNLFRPDCMAHLFPANRSALRAALPNIVCGEGFILDQRFGSIQVESVVVWI